MTTIELKSELYRQIDCIADSEPLMTKVLNYLRRLNLTTSAAMPAYTTEELNARIAESLQDIKAGRTITNEDAEKRLTEEFEWLR